jgi:hypothetical protein
VSTFVSRYAVQPKPTLAPRIQNSMPGVDGMSQWSVTMLAGMRSICAA